MTKKSKKVRVAIIGGPLVAPSSYFMKSPPEQFTDSVARQKTEDFIAGK